MTSCSVMSCLGAVTNIQPKTTTNKSEKMRTKDKSCQKQGSESKWPEYTM